MKHLFRTPAALIYKPIQMLLFQNLSKQQWAGFLKLLAATLVSQSASYFTLLVISRLLGIELFGRFAAVSATLTACFGLSTLGIGVMATRFVARFYKVDPARCGRILGLSHLASIASGCLLAIFLFLGAEILSVQLFRSSAYADLLRIAALCCPLMSLNAYQTGALLGFQSFESLLRTQLINSLFSLSFTTVLCYQYSLRGAVLAIFLSHCCAYLILRATLSGDLRSHQIAITFRDCWNERATLVDFAIPAAISGIIGSSAVWLAQYCLIRSAYGTTELALWTVASSIRAIVLLAPGVFAKSSGPIISSLHDSDEGQTYAQTLWSTTAVSTGSALVFGGLCTLVFPLWLAAWGASYQGAGVLLPIIVASAALEAYSSAVSQSLVAHGKLKLQLVIISVWAAMLLCVSVLGVERFGSLALALGYLMAWLTSALGYTFIALKLIALRKLQRAPRQTVLNSCPNTAVVSI